MAWSYPLLSVLPPLLARCHPEDPDFPCGGLDSSQGLCFHMTSSKGYSLTPPFHPKPPVITIANLFYCLFHTTLSEMMTLSKHVYLPMVPALEGKPYEVRLLVDFVPPCICTPRTQSGMAGIHTQRQSKEVNE